MLRRPCGLLFAACGAALCVIAEAQAQEVRLLVPAQPMGDALTEVARQSNTDVLFEPEVVASLRSRPVSGRMDAQQAIRLMLAGTPLDVLRDADGALIVRRAQTTSEVGAGQQAPNSVTRFPELVVTAAKREGVLRTTPMSLSIMDAAQLEASVLSSPRDLPRYAVGLNMTETNTGQRRITIRGIHSSGETTVGLYLDETPITAPNTATADPSGMTPDINLYDAQRVEVLRGPQGTLYGSGALSGALRIITNSADTERFAAELQSGAHAVEGGGAGTTLRAYVNAPLIEGALGMRVVVFSENRAGDIDNVRLGLSDVNTVETRGLRTHVTLRLARDATLKIMGFHQRQRVQDTDFWYPDVGENLTDNEVRLPFSNDLRLFNAVLEFEYGGVDLTGAVSAYRWDATRFIDSTRPARVVLANATYCSLYFDIGNPCNAEQADVYRAYVMSVLPVVGRQPMDVEVQTQEFRASSSGRRFEWTMGVFREHRADHSLSSAVRADAVTGAAIEPLTSVFLRETAHEIVQAAVFGELTYHLNDQWAVTVGARRYWYEKQTDSQVLQTSYLTGARQGDPASVRSQDDGVVSRASISYTPTRDWLVYAQYGEGFRPGGANTAPGLPAQYQTYTSDSVRSYEVGARTSLGFDWIDLHAVVYRIDWRAMQMMMQIPNFRYVANRGASRIEGGELELVARPTDQLTLRLTLSALSGRLTEAAGAGGERGDHIPFEPEMRALIGGSYSWAAGAGVEGAINLDYGYVGEAASEFNTSMADYETMGDYGALNAELSFTSPHWRFAFWGSNLLDGSGEALVQSSANAERFTLGLRPRTLGMTLSRSF